MPDATAPTSVIVVSAASIHAAAWVALLGRQPGIALGGTAPVPTAATLLVADRVVWPGTLVLGSIVLAAIVGGLLALVLTANESVARSSARTSARQA